MTERTRTPAPSRRSLFGAAVALPVLAAAPALASSRLHDGGASRAEWLAAHNAYRAAEQAHGDAAAAHDEAETAAAKMVTPPKALHYRYRYGSDENAQTFSEVMLTQSHIDRLLPEAARHWGRGAQRDEAIRALADHRAAEAAAERTCGVPEALAIYNASMKAEEEAFNHLLSLSAPDAFCWATLLQTLVARGHDPVALVTLAATMRRAAEATS